MLARDQRDLAQADPMQRLLQGDVGSGKTIVRRSRRCRRSRAAGRRRSWRRPRSWPSSTTASSPLARAARRSSVAWLTGSLPAKAREGGAARPSRSGEAKVAVGTHALLEDEVALPRLGLAIVDEQHRFGVAQRLALRGKGRGRAPHLLVMSATPIPRTLALTFYGDLDVSVIDELPPGRSRSSRGWSPRSAATRWSSSVREPCADGPAGVRGLPADRGVREARAADGRDAARGAAAPTLPDSASACCTGG